MRKSHQFLKAYPQEHAVDVIFHTGGTNPSWFERPTTLADTIMTTWYDWLDDNLTGYFHVTAKNVVSEKVFTFSFSEVRDAVLFKVFFG